MRPEEVIDALSKCLLLEICDGGTIDQPLLLERRYSLKKKKIPRMSYSQITVRLSVLWKANYGTCVGLAVLDSHPCLTAAVWGFHRQV